MPERQRHPFGPVYDARSRVLVLGSFPSVRSREEGFYYGHERNRFWPLLARIFGETPPADIEARRALLLRNRVALWDAAASCEISGSSDASIARAEPNDVSLILNNCDIALVAANGGTAARLYRVLCEPSVSRPAVALPSTSPANAAWSLDKLYGAWAPVLLDALR